MKGTMRNLAAIPFLMLIAGGPIACGGSGAPDGASSALAPGAGEPLIRTDRTEYVADRTGGGVSLDVAVHFTNRTSGPAWLSTCHGVYPPRMEKLVAGSWVPAYVPPVLLCLGAPLVVPRDGSYDETFMVRASPRGSNTYPQFELESVPGTYRLVWEIYEGDGSRIAEGETPRPLPLEQRVSNTFTIVER